MSEVQKPPKRIINLDLTAASVLSPGIEPATGLRLVLARSAQRGKLADAIGADADTEAMAKALGITPEAMGDVMAGKLSLTPGQVAMLAEHLGIEAAKLQEAADADMAAGGARSRSIDAADLPMVDAVLAGTEGEREFAVAARAAVGGSAAKTQALVAARRALAVAGIDAAALADIGKAPAAPVVTDGLPEPVQQALAAREAKWEERIKVEVAAREKLEKQVAAEVAARAKAEEARELGEIAAMVRSDMAGCEGKVEEIASRIQRARRALTPEDAKAFEAGLRAQSAARLALTGQRGRVDADEDTDAFEKAVKARMEEKKLSRALAIASMARDSDPDVRRIVHEHNRAAQA